jgi:hypothetical protein
MNGIIRDIVPQLGHLSLDENCSIAGCDHLANTDTLNAIKTQASCNVVFLMFPAWPSLQEK